MNNNNDVVLASNQNIDIVIVSNGEVFAYKGFNDQYTRRKRGVLLKTNDPVVYNIHSDLYNAVVGYYNNQTKEIVITQGNQNSGINTNTNNQGLSVGGNSQNMGMGSGSAESVILGGGSVVNTPSPKTPTKESVVVKKKVYRMEGYEYDQVPTKNTELEFSIVGEKYSMYEVKIIETGDTMEDKAHQDIYNAQLNVAKSFNVNDIKPMNVGDESISVCLNDDMAYTLLMAQKDPNDKVILVDGLYSSGYFLNASNVPNEVVEANLAKNMTYYLDSNSIMSNVLIDVATKSTDLKSWFDNMSLLLIGKEVEKTIINQYLLVLFKQHITCINNVVNFDGSNLFDGIDGLLTFASSIKKLTLLSKYNAAIDNIYRDLTNISKLRAFSIQLDSVANRMITCGGIEDRFAILSYTKTDIDAELELLIHSDKTYLVGQTTPLLLKIATVMRDSILFSDENDYNSGYFILFTRGFKIKVVVRTDNTFVVYKM